MDIFENFIDELKEENLLEQTVIKSGSKKQQPEISQDNLENNEVVLTSQKEEDELIIIDEFQLIDETDSMFEETEPVVIENAEADLPEMFEDNSLHKVEFEVNQIGFEINQTEIEANQIEFESNQSETETNQTEIAANRVEIETNQVEVKGNQVEASETPAVSQASGLEFYRKRANSEVSFLQMVEHVFAGLEREQMKIVPKPFDALAVKKVLHTFLQVSKDADNSDQAQAEFQLLQETENWYSSLTHRDKRISINHLRRYCETARPPLSSPALVSLARFYRNSPYSEQARGKFDFIVTRLFSKDIENERREMVFTRDELILHLKELYAEWSSIPLYSIEDDGSDVLLIALKFEDFMTEAAIAENFDELIKNDFFNRLRLFKKSTNENFFSPLIVVASIESNIKIGNRYVELLEKERANKSLFEDKYGFLHDQTISDATGKTFQLVELLSRKADKPKLVELPPEISTETKPAAEPKKQKEAPRIKESAKPRAAKPAKEQDKADEKQSLPSANQIIQTEASKNIFGINRWLLIAAVLTVICALGFYVLVNPAADAKGVAGASKINLIGSLINENIRSERINGGILTAVVLPSWNSLDDENKKELLKNILAKGDEREFSKVQLITDEGKTVGFASANKLEVYNP